MSDGCLPTITTVCRDICGAVNYPIIRAKTLIIGADREAIARLLLIVSYFIRCGDVTVADGADDLTDSGCVTKMLDQCDAIPTHNSEQQQLDTSTPTVSAAADGKPVVFSFVVEDDDSADSTTTISPMLSARRKTIGSRPGCTADAMTPPLRSRNYSSDQRRHCFIGCYILSKEFESLVR